MPETRVLDGDWPLAQGYGPATFDGEPPGHGCAHWHEGWDLACPTGTVCRAPVAATVVRAGPGYVVLLDADQVELYYFHISQLLAPVNRSVAAGAPVALSGQEAVAGGVAPTGPHLHFGVRRSPYRYQVDDFDPTPYALEDDMTPEQAQQLADVHNLLTASGAIPTAGALKQIEDQVAAVQQRLDQLATSSTPPPAPPPAPDYSAALADIQRTVNGIAAVVASATEKP